MKTKIDPVTGKKTRIVRIVKNKKRVETLEDSQKLNDVISKIRHSVQRSLSQQDSPSITSADKHIDSLKTTNRRINDQIIKANDIFKT